MQCVLWSCCSDNFHTLNSAHIPQNSGKWNGRGRSQREREREKITYYYYYYYYVNWLAGVVIPDRDGKKTASRIMYKKFPLFWNRADVYFFFILFYTYNTVSKRVTNKRDIYFWMRFILSCLSIIFHAMDPVIIFLKWNIGFNSRGLIDNRNSR